MHRPSIGLVIASLTLAFSATWAPARISAAPAKIHVVIVGVPNWSIQDYKDGRLGSDIHERCGEIVQFFKKRFSGGQVAFHPNDTDPCTVENTTYAAIRKMMYVDLPRFSRGTLTFVFMMSHGEIDRYKNPFLSQDLRFITSDTPNDDREVTSLSIGIELLNWLEKVPPASTVLVFVDTCNSGSVETMKLQLEQAMQQYVGLRFGLIVASLADESTYQANFTRAVLDLWSGSRCPADPDEVASRLYDLIKARTKIKQLSGVDGLPNVLIPYGGSWCLNQLGSDQKLLFLYQGAERNVVWSIQARGEYGLRRSVSVAGAPFKLLLVPAGIYSVAATLSDGRVVRLGSADLTQASTAPVFLSRPTTSEDLAETVTAYAGYAKYRGVTAEEGAQLDEVAAIVESRKAGAPVRAGTNALTPADIDRIFARAAGDPDELAKSARALIGEGDFQGASRLLIEAVTRVKDIRAKQQLGAAAYLAAGAAGDLEEAAAFRRQLPGDGEGVVVAPIVSAEQKALQEKTPQTRDSFAAAATLELIKKEIPMWQAALVPK